MKKAWKKVLSLTFAFSLSMLPLLNPVGIVYAEGKPVTEAEIAANDNVVYFVNCGATITNRVHSTDRMGVYQSVTDQEYAEDAGTGYKWGIRPNDKNSVRVAGGTSSSLDKTVTYWYTADNIQYLKGTSGFYYDFELPSGTYDVTVGFKNPWDTRTVDIVLEDETAVEALTITKGVLVEKTYSTTVSDDELNVFIHNPRRTSSYADPLVNYIIVKKVIPVIIDIQTLQEKIEFIESKISDHTVEYAKEPLDAQLYLLSKVPKDSLQDLEPVLDAAKALVDSGDASQEAIAASIKELDSMFSNLRIIETNASFTGTVGDVWKDTNGMPIQAHGGQVQKIGDKWWWVGEDKTKGYRSNGISMYSSDDLYNWDFEGFAMRTISKRADLDNDPYFIELYGDLTAAEKDYVYLCINDSTAVLERPKMIYNEKTDKYVIWFHADGPTETSSSNYAASSSGVAISDSPSGPFKFIKRSKLHRLPDEDYGTEWFEEVQYRGMARDMSLFIDDDQTAYIIYSSEENRTMFISRLNDEYTDLEVPATPIGEAKNGIDFVRLFPGAQREAPAMFKYEGKYYMITSGATGWASNQARCWVADEILGEWTNLGDPCVSNVGDLYASTKTFHSQSTHIIPVDAEAGKFIYMGDRWFNPDNGEDLSQSRYIWLPLILTSTGGVKLQSYKNWTLEELESINNLKINPGQIEELYYRYGDLPKTLSVQIRNGSSWETKNVAITWTTGIKTLKPASPATITGIFIENGIEFEVTAKAVNLPESLKYFIDCGGSDGSDLFDFIQTKGIVPGLLNKVHDQAFDSVSGWGYTGVIGKDIDYKNKTSRDSFESGWWAYGNKTIDYKFKLEDGLYGLTAGFQEWWSTSRNMKIVISYADKEGKTVTWTVSEFVNSGESTHGGNFSVVNINPENPYVTVSVSKVNSSNPDPVLSWLAIIPDDLPSGNNSVVSVDTIPDKEVSLGTSITELGLPEKVYVTLEDGRYYAAIEWDTSSYDGSIAGVYELIGILEMPVGIPENPSIVNPLNLTASIKITVNPSVVKDLEDMTLAELIERAQEELKKTDIYTEGSWENLDSVVKTAIDILENGREEFIESATQELIVAIKGLVLKNPNVTSLEEFIKLIEEARVLADTVGIHTQESRDNLIAVLDSIDEYGLENFDDQMIADFIEAINTCIDALELVNQPLVVDKSKLLKVIGKAALLTSDEYTAKSWAYVQENLIHAMKIYTSTIEDQELVDAIANELQGAIDELVDLKELKAAIARETEAVAGNYTLLSWYTAQIALYDAKAVLAKSDATAAEVNAAANALNNAFNNLVLKVNKDVLKRAIEAAESYDTSFYTTISVLKMKLALSDARKVYNGSGYSQAEVDAAISALKNTIEALVVQVIKVELKELITSTSAIGSSDYTFVSWYNLRLAISAATTVVNDANATQAQVDAQVVLLKAAQAALVLK